MGRAAKKKKAFEPVGLEVVPDLRTL